MVARILLGGQGKPLPENDLSVIAVLRHDADKALFTGYGQADQALLRIGDLADRLHGIVQDVSEKGRQIHGVHEVQRLSVRHAVESDPLLVAEDGLGSHDGIQDRIPGPVQILELVDLLFHPGQAPGLFLVGDMALEIGDLVL